MSQSTRVELSQRMEQRLDAIERQALLLSLRVDLIRAVRGDHYAPRAECPRCSHRLTDLEILKGFRRDPLDTTTACPTCQHRFQPYLVCHPFSGVRYEVAFYCPDQTLTQLRDFAGFSPEEIERRNAAAFRSALFHFGSLTAAFGRLGTPYTLGPTLPEWRDKVKPFLGRLSDVVIAETLGVPTPEVRTLRRRLGIPGCRSRTRQY